ncbi:MAG: hypothetical protein L7F77_11110 [Candidatus Magnetominusculus sp. LBB02]|nr:hypothetical protein [Candidatus Magnetominusculus sp. LBB02]
MKTEKAEQMRIRYKYRTLIMKGRLVIHYKGAVQLVGPDCAFHLYSTINTGSNKRRTKKNQGDA